jgi:ATP-binding cassette subfamily B protein
VVDAPILVLDDALSSVDNRTATAILNALSEGTQQKTVLFISHQMSAAATADRIFVMDKGRIVQQGRHSDLVQQPWPLPQPVGTAPARIGLLKGEIDRGQVLFDAA